jgi:molecular chaperone DnaJ
MILGTDNAFTELGLAADATEIEVKAAWRRLASQWHPDRNDSASAVAKMQRINQAFEEIRRARFGAAAPAPRADDTDRQQQQQRPPIQRKVRLTLEEAAAGCIKVLRGRITDTCAACAGAGHQVLGGNCAQCGGSGAMTRRSWFGWPSMSSAECDACLGGGIARQPCRACHGSGKLDTRSYTLNVRIPQGVRNGDLLHVDGRHQRAGQPLGGVDIRVEVLAHALFQLDDQDGTIRCQMPVDGFAWVANRLIQVPTLDGLQPLQLSRERLAYRLPGRGFPIERRGPRGDHRVTLVPVFPGQFSTDQEILLDQLIATSSAAGGPGTDERLGAWNKRLRAWERGVAGRGR